MELIVKRTIKSPNSTISEFSIDGVKTYFGLEPFDRGLTNEMSLEQIKVIKVHHSTAIPTGRYRLTREFSQKHQKDVPFVNDVKGFEGIEIHVGNFPKDTDGCLLLGTGHGPDEVVNSKVAIDAFYKTFFAAIANDEMVFITYED